MSGAYEPTPDIDDRADLDQAWASFAREIEWLVAPYLFVVVDALSAAVDRFWDR